MSATPRQTEAQRLADAIESITATYGECREAAAELRRQGELLQGALSTMTGEYHIYRGLCPDAIAGWDSTDPDCPACAVITAIRNHLEVK